VSDNGPTILTEISPREALDDATLIAWLREPDAECPLCNYNLRGLTKPCCPECGQLLRLSVALAEHYLKAWIALMASTASGAGIGLICLFGVLRVGMPGRREIWLDILTVDFILMVPAAVAALATRRRFLTLPREIQWRFAAIPLVLVGARYLLFVMKVLRVY
jgi:hypothetical protein